MFVQKKRALCYTSHKSLFLGHSLRIQQILRRQVNGHSQNSTLPLYYWLLTDTSAPSVIDVLNTKKLQFSAYNWIREIHWWAKKFTDIKFTWIGREANKVADYLVKQKLLDNCTFQFNYYF